jgi:hypothetical protein
MAGTKGAVAETTARSAEFMRLHPHAHISEGLRPSCTAPEVGWMSQCRHRRCSGHWRTGLASEAAAFLAYEAHLRDSPACNG